MFYEYISLIVYLCKNSIGVSKVYILLHYERLFHDYELLFEYEWLHDYNFVVKLLVIINILQLFYARMMSNIGVRETACIFQGICMYCISIDSNQIVHMFFFN